MVNCAVLGFAIDREEVCFGRGDHPLCEKCLNRENEMGDLQGMKRKTTRLSDELLQSVRKLVADECGNFQRTGPMGIKNHCWKEKSNTGVCVYFSHDRPECNYFEGAVLPLKPDLEESYLQKGEGEVGRPNFHREAVHGGLGASTARHRRDEESRLAFRPGRKGKALVSSLGNPGLGQKKIGLKQG